MKFFIEKLPDLQALYIRQLRLLLSAEEQIVRALPAMKQMAADAQLQQAFQSHLEETELHVALLRDILTRIAGESEPLKCKVLTALVDEAEDMVQSCIHAEVRDAALIAAAQRVEHYEIAAYGAARQFAHVLGREMEAEILNQTIHEEGHAEQLLSDIAERVNPTARREAA